MAALQNSSKKRSAPSQSGPKSKKVHLEKSKPDKKRSQPITRPAQDSESENDSDLEDDGESPIEEVPLDEDAMEVDTVNKPLKDPNGELIYVKEILLNQLDLNSLSRIAQGPKSSSGTTTGCETTFIAARRCQEGVGTCTTEKHPNGGTTEARQGSHESYSRKGYRHCLQARRQPYCPDGGQTWRAEGER